MVRDVFEQFDAKFNIMTLVVLQRQIAIPDEAMVVNDSDSNSSVEADSDGNDEQGRAANDGLRRRGNRCPHNNQNRNQQAQQAQEAVPAVGIVEEHKQAAPEQPEPVLDNRDDEQLRQFIEFDELPIGEEGSVTSIQKVFEMQGVDYLKVQDNAWRNNAFRYSPSLHCPKKFE